LTAGPLRLATKVHPLLKPVPLRVPHHPSAVRPVGRTSSPRFLFPPTTSLGLAPYEAGRSLPTPVPLSGLPTLRQATSQRFPSRPKFRGLVSCRNRSWDSPFRVFPSQKSRTPLGATCSLAVIHRRAGALLPEPYHRRFPRRPRFWRSSLIPPPTMGSLSARRGALPGPPGSKPQNRSVPPASPASKP